MGVIQIRDRRESLGNIGGVRGVNTDVGAVRAIGAIAEANSRAEGAKYRMLGDALGTLGDLARTGLKVAAKAQAEADERDAEDAANAYKAERDAFRAGHEGATVGEGGAFKTTADWRAADEDNRAQLAERHFGGLSDNARRMAERRLVGYELQIGGRDNRRAVAIERAHTAATADESLANARQLVLGLDDESSVEARAIVWDDYNTALERDMDANGVVGEAERRDFRRKNALELVKGAMDARLRGMAQGAETLDRKAIEAAYDALESQVKVDGVGAFINGDVTNAKGQLLANYLSADLKDADVDALGKAALEDVGNAKARALRACDAREREFRENTIRAGVERELSFRDLPQEKWADAYEALGRDKEMRKAAPERAKAYLDTAREMREAELAAAERAREKSEAALEKAHAVRVKENEENLKRSFETMDVLKLNGALSQDDASESQAAIWRTFSKMALSGEVSPNFVGTFKKRLFEQLSEQEADAMRRFYEAFGYYGEVGSDGSVPASVRRGDTTWYKLQGSKSLLLPSIVPAEELYDYGDTLLRKLRSLDPDTNREAVVEKTIERLKIDGLKVGRDANREALVKIVTDIQREELARQARPEADRQTEQLRAERESKSQGRQTGRVIKVR